MTHSLTGHCPATGDAILPPDLANAVRVLSMDAVEAAGSGHPGMPMGMADAATVLFTRFLKFDPASPEWPDRDRFILSAGHGSILIYSLLHLAGYARPTMEDIRGFRSLGSPCAGHPENFELKGIEATTGPLGSGVATAVGMAIAERHLRAVFGVDLVDHRTWAIAGDGCLMEGVNHEAAGLAGHLGLGRLCVLWDDNRITIDGALDLSSSEDIAARYAAYGWHVARCDGHNPDAVAAAIEQAIADPRPSLIACRTIIGFGAPTKQGSSSVHGSPLGSAEAAAARQALGWSAAPFEIPDPVAGEWRRVGSRGRAAHTAWRDRCDRHPDRAEFDRRMRGKLPADFTLTGHAAALLAEAAPMATREASERALNIINELVPETFGGSADLTGSNNTRSRNMESFTADRPAGRYLHYGVREFGMACAMNGIALHKGVIPYGGTFLVFSDYCRAAIRLAALQRIRSIFVLTHDSIGLGADGPTHQPIEHLMSLRLIPNLHVYRPADAIETAECWELALRRTDGPSALVLSRQNLPLLRSDGASNRCALGAYRLVEAAQPRHVILFASGSEVSIAVRVAALLAARDLASEVISMPCWERFAAQPLEYQNDLLAAANAEVLRVSIEAGSTSGWHRYVGQSGMTFGLDSFGASGAADDLYRHFGLEAQQIADRITDRVRQGI